MTGVQLNWREDFDEPWRRLPWIVLSALLAWTILLGAFGRMLRQQPPPQPPPAPIEARIVELPPPAAGLQGGASAKAATAAPPPAALPKPAAIAKPGPAPVHHVKKLVRRHPAAIAPPSPFGTAKHVEHPRVEAPPVAAKAPAPATLKGGSAKSRPDSATGAIGGGTGSASGAGLGSDSSGARAVYAPAPAIPGDMREEPFSTVAVARFKVSPEGNVDVTLVTPTPNPRLNQILLDTLKEWKFFPAMKDGVAVNSEFELRIPIAVQ